ncbi:hypothetical protein OQA88_1143 [Cercophora sp. LCS_1]
MRIIMWITNSIRPLHANELCCALSIGPDDTCFDEDNRHSLEPILSVCAGLVVDNKERDLVHLVHHTAHEFFNEFHKDKREEMQQSLALTYLTYLCFDEHPARHPHPRPPRSQTKMKRPTAS